MVFFRFAAVAPIAVGVAVLASCLPIAAAPLQRLAPTQPLPAALGLDTQIWPGSEQGGDRAQLLQAIDHSLRYLDTPRAIKAYAQYPVPGITRVRVRRSLQRFRTLVQVTRSPEELQVAVRREFDLYRAVGKDGKGTVAYTGYFEPVYPASRVPTDEFRYPLFRRPSTLSQWPQPHPTRLQLEGADGLQADKGPLKGLELVWLRDRLQAFLIQVQGSARLTLTDGTTMTVGYAGSTDRKYTGIGRELVKDGKMRIEDLTLPALITYFQANPQEMNQYLPRNASFVFFRDTQGTPATGSLGLPVTADRSIATDKKLMPPGALALIDTRIPYPNAQGQLEQRQVSRFVLDQDTGGAIIGPGRVDIFMGTGALAGDRAGLINATGQLYYLLLKDAPPARGKN